MSKQRHRRRSQGGTSPETTPQTGSGVAHFSVSEVVQFSMSVDNDLRFADLTPAQGVALLAEERVYVGSESTIYHIIRQEGLLSHRGRTRLPREPRDVSV